MTDADLRHLIEAFAQVVQRQAQHLTDLDAAIGDADHGTNLSRGLQKSLEALAQVPEGDVQAIAKKVGMTMMSTVGGASGALWGTFMLRAAGQLPAAAHAAAEEALRALDAGIAGMRERGKAEPGDKTMLDVWLAAQERVRDRMAAGDSPAAALAQAAAAALEAAERTVPLAARRGRASYLGERSAGHMDPGSLSTVYFWQSAAGVWADR